jgi:hypothetical protein
MMAAPFRLINGLVLAYLGVGVVPVQFVTDDVFARVYRPAPVQNHARFADVGRAQVARLTRHCNK